VVQRALVYFLVLSSLKNKVDSQAVSIEVSSFPPEFLGSSIRLNEL
jgi:hypothetical protein